VTGSSLHVDGGIPGGGVVREPPQVDGLDGGAGRGRSVEMRSLSEQMSDALRAASGRQPGTYGED
jgi:hypothetical protein